MIRAFVWKTVKSKSSSRKPLNENEVDGKVHDKGLRLENR